MGTLESTLAASVECILPEPEPLQNLEEALDYPIDALPPTLRGAVEAYQSYGQQPLALVACSALASASLAVQGLVNVQRDYNLIGPVSLNVAVVAESGERKTSADRRMTRSAREWLEQDRERTRPERDAAKARKQAHVAECEGLLAKIKSASGRAKARGSAPQQADIAALRDRLMELQAQMPPDPIAPSLFHEDCTPEGLAQDLALGWPSSSLWSDEGGIVIGSHACSEETVMRYLGLLNRLWDGQPYERHRTTARSFVIEGRRFTTSLMMQPHVMRTLCSAERGVSRGMGFLARFLFAWPKSTQGRRFYREFEQDKRLENFDDRIMELLHYPLPTEGPSMKLTPPALALETAARALWIEYHDEVERELRPFGEFCEVRDFAAKAAENAARVAAIFHVIENGPEGTVTSQMFEAGAQITAWHLSEAMRIMSYLESPTRMSDDAQILLGFLLEKNLDAVVPRFLSQYGPLSIRRQRRRDAAIEVLVETKHLLPVNGPDKSPTFRVNPRLRGLQ
jgi:hypothetical protein